MNRLSTLYRTGCTACINNGRALPTGARLSKRSFLPSLWTHPTTRRRWISADVGFALLHNVVRSSLLYFIGRSAACLSSAEPARLASEIQTVKEQHRASLRQRLTDLQRADKADFLQYLSDRFVASAKHPDLKARNNNDALARLAV